MWARVPLACAVMCGCERAEPTPAPSPSPIPRPVPVRRTTDDPKTPCPRVTVTLAVNYVALETGSIDCVAPGPKPDLPWLKRQLAKIAALRAPSCDDSLWIVADSQIEYASVVAVLDAAHHGGFNNIGFATDRAFRPQPMPAAASECVTP